MRTFFAVRRTVAASILAAMGLGCALPAMANPLQGANHLQGAAPLQGVDPADGTAGQIDALNAQIAVLEARLKVAKLRASIKKAEDGQPAASTGAPTPLAGQPIPFQGVASYPAPSESRAALPRVESISGAGSRLSAMVSLPGGGRRIVVPGSRLPGGIVVRSVTQNGVEVSGKRGAEWLSFLNGGASRDDGQSPSSMFGPSPLQGINPMGAAPLQGVNPPPMGMPGASPMPGTAQGGE